MEDSGSNFKSPARSLHHLPQLPPQVLGGSRNRYRHPRGQTASAFCGLEGGSPVRDLLGPAQGVCRIGQVQVPQCHVGIRYGTPIMSDPLDILESAEDGGKGGRVLRSGVHRCSGSEAGRPIILHHFQRSDGCGSESLGVSNGGGSVREGRERTRGNT